VVYQLDLLFTISLRRIWVHDLPEIDTELLPYWLQLRQVLVILGLVLDLGLDSLKDTDSSWVVIDAASGAESGDDDGWGWDEIVGECVVQISLLWLLDSVSGCCVG